MSKNSIKPRSGARQRRPWSRPELTRLEAGRAELGLGPFSDGPNNS